VSHTVRSGQGCKDYDTKQDTNLANCLERPPTHEFRFAFSGQYLLSNIGHVPNRSRDVTFLHGLEQLCIAPLVVFGRYPRFRAGFYFGKDRLHRFRGGIAQEQVHFISICVLRSAQRKSAVLVSPRRLQILLLSRRRSYLLQADVICISLCRDVSPKVLHRVFAGTAVGYFGQQLKT
jgi:hypothetical protein